MTKQEILLKRFNFIKQMWLNTKEGSPEQEEWEKKMDICLKEMKKYRETLNKPRKGTSELGSEVMVKYIGLKEKGSQEG